MHHTLTEQEITLLSAYHDGEVTPAERIEVERLLERSSEANAWLRDMNSVHTLSVGAAVVPGSAVLSGKLSGAAIVAASGTSGAGGAFMHVMRSPLGIAGTAAVLVAGAIVAFNPFGGREIDSDHVRPSATVASTIDDNAAESRPTTMAAEAAVVPPMTPAALVDFALTGALPIDEERTQFLCFDESDAAAHDRHTAREIESGLASLEHSAKRSLDSLSELIAGSVVKLENGGYGVRDDVPELQAAVISRLEGAGLSTKAKSELAAARNRAEQNGRRLGTALDEEMRRMQNELAVGNDEPYVLFDMTGIDEGTPNRTQYRSIFSMLGERTQVVVVDPGSIRMVEPSVRLTSLRPAPAPSAPVEPAARKKVRRDDDVLGMNTKKTLADDVNIRPKDTEAENGLVQTQENGLTLPTPKATKPFLQRVTITLSAPGDVQLVVSDDIDTTFESQQIQPGVLYVIGPEIDEMTGKLNREVEKVINDRSRSSRDRAREIIRLQSEYEQQLLRLINGPFMKRDNSDGQLDPKPQDADSTKEAHDEEEAACLPAPADKRVLQKETTCISTGDCSEVS